MKILRVLAFCLLICLLACMPSPLQEQLQRPTVPPTVPSAPPVEDTTATQPQEPEQPSILHFLQIAAQPVGKTMYVWGGGWNKEDTGAGIDAVRLGLGQRWEEFASRQDETYDYNTTRYQIHDGLDCSGYVGWAVYNTLETENDREGYVYTSTQVAQKLADRGFGEFIPLGKLTTWLPGDVMSMKGHCWIVVGMCDDGSVLLLHSSPPGVRFCGTVLPDGSKSQAVALAERIMKEHYPDWYRRYPDCTTPISYLRKSSAMRWSLDVLCDDENLREMGAEAVVSAIFGR